MTRRGMTPVELDRAVASLHAVGGLYEIVALLVEHYNRPHVTAAEAVVPQQAALAVATLPAAEAAA